MQTMSVSVEHGGTGYKKGCRCEVCTRANTDYHRQYRKRSPERHRVTQQITNRALWVLAGRHRAEYEDIRGKLKAEWEV